MEEAAKVGWRINQFLVGCLRSDMKKSQEPRTAKRTRQIWIHELVPVPLVNNGAEPWEEEPALNCRRWNEDGSKEGDKLLQKR